MATTSNALFCALAGLAFWTVIGIPIARRLFPGTIALPLAPALGWAAHSALALPLFTLIGFTRLAVTATSVAALMVCVAALLWTAPRSTEPSARVGWAAYAAAALVACVVLSAILPKAGPDGVVLATAAYDHAKVAMVDDMARLGLPAGNPAIGENGAAGSLSYYYLWHFSAAELALVLGVSGWEADAGLTGFTAFASLALMMGWAAWLSGRAAAALFVALLAVTGTGRLLVLALSGRESLGPVLSDYTFVWGWMLQGTWAPQHLAAALCVLLAAATMERLGGAPRPGVMIFGTAVLGSLVAAGVGSSTWVGGVTFLFAALAIAIVLLVRMPGARRERFVWALIGAAVIAALLASPILLAQYVAARERSLGFPVAFELMEVLQDAIPSSVRPWLNIPAFWLVLLPLELPAVAVAGAIVLRRYTGARHPVPEQRSLAVTLAALAVASLTVGWLLVSTVGTNNDLGWRAVLPAVLVLMIFTAVGLAHWLAQARWVPFGAALCGVLLGLPDGIRIAYLGIVGPAERASKLPEAFAQAPAMWAAVRRHAGPADRVINDPAYLQQMMPWPINMTWALLANRRSCYAGREHLLVMAPLTAARREEITALFTRIYAGAPTAQDMEDVAVRFDCRVALVTSRDVAWSRDPFAASALYRLAEQESGRWRIYVRVERAVADAAAH